MLTLIRVYTLTITVFTICFVSGSAFAQEKSVAPFGITLGKATLKEVRRVLGGRIEFEERGINKYSYGPMLFSDGSGLGLDGLNSILIIFDRKEILVGVIMDMNNSRFDAIHGYLNNKYPLVKSRIPFVGDKYLRYRLNDVTIEVNAPHMSFEMDVSYLCDSLNNEYQRQSAEERKNKKNHEEAQF